MYMDQFITFMTAEADTSAIREETFMEEEHIVVPVIALVEGVIEASNASSGPELALASEFAKAPDGWDGRPIVMNHPQINGQMVSANKPKVLEGFSFGQMFNTRLDNGKLKSEAWLSKPRIKELGGEVEQTVERIMAGTTVEVSTGLFTEVERANGRFNGENFSGIWRSVVPDHLAFLSQGTKGACSVEDGCGVPRLNRARIKSTNDCGCGCEEATMPTRELYTRVCDIITNSIPDTVIDSDARRALSDGVQKKFGAFSFLVAFTQEKAIFQDIEGSFFSVAFNMDEDGAIEFTGEPESVRLMTRIVPVSTSESRGNTGGEGENETEEEASSEEQAEENVSMSDQTENGTQEETTSPGESQAEENSNAQPREETPGTEAEATEEVTPGEGQSAEAAEEAPEETPEPPLTAQEYIQKAPTEIQEVLNSGLAAHNQRKASLITNIKASGRCEFDDNDLNKMSVTTLEKMAKLSKVPVYTGNAAPTSSQDPEPDVAPAPPNVFPIQSASNASNE